MSRIRQIIAAVIATYATAGTARAQTVTITREGCAALTQYTPSPDVEYKPGADVVNGERVAPADLNDVPPLTIVGDIHVVISVELQKRLGIPADPNAYKPEAFLGDVRVTPDGRAYFNGQPLQNDAAYELAQACQKQGTPGATVTPQRKR